MLSTKSGGGEFAFGRVAPRHGFEPRFTAPKAAVLPLDDRGIWGEGPNAMKLWDLLLVYCKA